LTKTDTGHRERLRNRFLKREEGAHTDEALLELLLTYAIPQKDLKPLAKELITKLGGLKNVFSADVETLCNFNGVKIHSATLLKLVEWICLHYSGVPSTGRSIRQQAPQPTLFESLTKKPTESAKMRETPSKPTKKVLVRRGTGLFGKAVLKEAIDLIPRLPDIESLDQVREFLRKNLHFSAQQTRRRYADYIAFRMFPHGNADKALRQFAVRYPSRQELKDVCFYRFCKAEPLMFEIIENLFLPSIGAGQLKRESLREYLQQRFPSSKSIKDSAKAIVDALVAGGITRANYITVSFSYHDILIPSFAFILHSEFQEPGMYDIAKLESNRAIRAMLWNPNRILSSLYELRNQGIISKISEIDNIRQFTTRWTLDDLIAKLPEEKGRS